MEDDQDVGFTEDQMIAQAIALSLAPGPPLLQVSYESQSSRAATNQSMDSALSPESSLPLRQSSQSKGINYYMYDIVSVYLCG